MWFITYFFQVGLGINLRIIMLLFINKNFQNQTLFNLILNISQAISRLRRSPWNVSPKLPERCLGIHQLRIHSPSSQQVESDQYLPRILQLFKNVNEQYDTVFNMILKTVHDISWLGWSPLNWWLMFPQVLLVFE